MGRPLFLGGWSHIGRNGCHGGLLVQRHQQARVFKWRRGQRVEPPLLPILRHVVLPPCVGPGGRRVQICDDLQWPDIIIFLDVHGNQLLAGGAAELLPLFGHESYKRNDRRRLQQLKK